MSTSHKPHLRRTVYTGTFLHTPALGQLEILENAVIGVNEHGVIAFIHKGLPSRYTDPSDNSSQASLGDELRSKLESVEWGEQDESGEGDSARNSRGWKWFNGSMDGNGWFFPGFIGTYITYSVTYITAASQSRDDISYGHY